MPEVALLGLVSVCEIVDPDPPLAPVIPPVVPATVHVNVDGVDAVRAIEVVAPLHIECVGAVVTTGVGKTVIIILKGDPAQFPAVEVGVTIYSTVPEFTVLGLVSVWLRIVPVPLLAPVMPPEMVPIVHA